MSDTDSPSEMLASRAVIPSWKAPDQAIEYTLPNQKTLLHRKALATRWLQELESGYVQAPSNYKAVELYETALMHGLEDQLPNEIRKLGMASLIHTNQNTTSFWEVDQTNLPDVLNTNETLNQQYWISINGVKTYKKLLSENPNRPFCWSELARHYLVLKQDDKAVRCIQNAMHLSKNNRYLSRAATRLFVHIKESDRAVKLLHSVPGFLNDPWLLSAEIAASSFTSRTSRHINTAQKLLKSQNFSTYQLSELAAAIGTIEMDNGATKKAKSLFNTSLLMPTANSLAQAQWAVQRDSSIIIPVSAWNNTTAPYEASALAARQERNWRRVVSECAKWLADEPYSTRPIYMASYISFFPDLQEIAAQFATVGLNSEPNNSMLLNNRAVARAYLGKLEEAWKDIVLALKSNEGKNSAHLHATFGLVAFRSGYPEVGREFYRTTIAWFSKKRDKESLSSAVLHYLREEARLDESLIPQAIEITKKIKNVTSAVKTPELISFCEVLLSELASNSKINGAALERVNAPVSSEQFKNQIKLFEFPKNEEIQNEMISNIKDITKLI